MDKTTHEVRLAYWKDIARKCQARPEGQTAASWLKENGIHNKQYYYWLRKIRREAYEEMKAKSLPTAADRSDVAFAEIPLPSQISQQEAVSGFHADAVIRINTATVAVSNNASAELLSRIVQAVSHAC